MPAEVSVIQDLADQNVTADTAIYVATVPPNGKFGKMRVFIAHDTAGVPKIILKRGAAAAVTILANNGTDVAAEAGHEFEVSVSPLDTFTVAHSKTGTLRRLIVSFIARD